MRGKGLRAIVTSPEGSAPLGPKQSLGTRGSTAQARGLRFIPPLRFGLPNHADNDNDFVRSASASDAPRSHAKRSSAPIAAMSLSPTAVPVGSARTRFASPSVAGKDADGRAAARDQWIFYGAGAAAVVAGVLVWRVGAAKTATVAVVPRPDGAALAWSGAW